jgi:hypothetical protein
VSSRVFFGAVAGELASNTTTASPTPTASIFWRRASSQAWGGCTTVSSSCPLDLQSIFLCLVFVFLILFVLVVSFQFCLYFSYTQKSIKISVAFLFLQYGCINY